MCKETHWLTNGQRGDHPNDQETISPHEHGAALAPNIGEDCSLDATTRKMWRQRE